jgi:hypothetical protein
MRVPKTSAIDTYGHSFVLFEARGRRLDVYKHFNIAAAPDEGEDISRVGDPQDYKTNPPDRLILREVLGDYQHFEKKGARTDGGFAGIVSNLMTKKTWPPFIFNAARDVEAQANEIMTAAGKDIPVQYDYLPGQVSVPALIKKGDTVYAHRRNISDYPLKLSRLTVEDAEFATLGVMRMLSVTARAQRSSDLLVESFSSRNAGRPWVNDQTDSDLVAYLSLESAQKGIRAFAQRVHKNIRPQL